MSANEMPERIWLSPEGAHLPYQPTMHWKWQEYRRADLCASGRQVRVSGGLVVRCREIIEWHETAMLEGEALREMATDIAKRLHQDMGTALAIAEKNTLLEAARILAALTPASQPEGQECSRCGSVGGFGCYECTPSAATPTAQEAVPVAWRVRPYVGCSWRLCDTIPPHMAEDWQREPLYAHPPHPSEAVAEATNHALDACRIIDAAALEGHDNTSDLILHLLEAVEPARAALRALKGEE